MIAPDNGQGATGAITSPIRSFVNSPQPQAVVNQASASNLNLAIPTWGTGGSGTNFDLTTSSINVGGHPNQTITDITATLNLNHQMDGDLEIFLQAPNGSFTTLYYKPGDTTQNLLNVTFSDAAAQSINAASGPYDGKTYQPTNSLTALDGSSVNGTYTLYIYDLQGLNTGILNNWSITVNSTQVAPNTFQSGAAMDQNADGTTDQNALTTPFTGLVPGDLYVAPMPAPASPFTFNATNILTPPYDQHTLPLVVPGPYVTSISVPNGSGNDNLILNGMDSTVTATFSQPMKVSSFSPSDVLQIMGPAGPIIAPQLFSSSAPSNIAPGVTSSTLTIPQPVSSTAFPVGKVTIQLNITNPDLSKLSAALIAPDGTTVTLFNAGDLSGANLVGTAFDDSAVLNLSQQSAPYTGVYLPVDPARLAHFLGTSAVGKWTLQVTDSVTGKPGTLNSWSLTITPQVTVRALNADANGNATQFEIGFPQQFLSGTYTVQLGPNILDTNVTSQYPNGQPLDTNLNAGVDVLRGQGPNDPVTTLRYNGPFLPKGFPDATVATLDPKVYDPTVPSASKVVAQSTIIVPDSFVVQGDTTSSGLSGLVAQLNLTYPNDPNLEVVLTHGTKSVILFSGVGTGVRTSNFTNTIFDDGSATPIQQGGAPFFGTFRPQESLASAFANSNAQGGWTLTVIDSTGSATAGSFNAWSLTFQKSLPSSGLGDPVTDNVNASFRIFTMNPTNALSRDTWTAVGPASISGASGRVGGLAIDPSDPTGNTVYVGGASGGIWKTTNFLTNNPLGPTYIPLTDFGVTFGINTGSIAVFPRNHDTNQSIIIAATGEGDPSTGNARCWLPDLQGRWCDLEPL